MLTTAVPCVCAAPGCALRWRRRARAAGLALASLALLAGCAGPRAPSSIAPPMAPPQPATLPLLALSAAEREGVVARAMLVVNTPYTYGGNTPEGGFDCSGLVQYVFTPIAPRRLPRSTAQWATVSEPVDGSQLQRGDLVFFNTSGAAFSHMGIYVGQGQFVHAPSRGGTVRLARLDQPYFAQRFMGGRTLFRR